MLIRIITIFFVLYLGELWPGKIIQKLTDFAQCKLNVQKNQKHHWALSGDVKIVDQ